MNMLYERLKMQIALADDEMQSIERFLTKWQSLDVSGLFETDPDGAGQAVVTTTISMTESLNRLVSVHEELYQAGKTAILAEIAFPTHYVASRIKKCVEFTNETIAFCQAQVGRLGLIQTEPPQAFYLQSTRRLISRNLQYLREVCDELMDLISASWPRSDQSSEWLAESRNQMAEGKVVPLSELLNQLQGEPK